LKPYLKKYNLLPVCLFTFFVIITLPSNSQTGIFTQHNDLNRTGWNQNETVLNTNNVRPGSFGKIFIRSVDDQIYAQPLVVQNVNVPGSSNKNIVIVATVNNSVYAFDADSADVNNPYWQVHLTQPGSRVVKSTDMTRACGGNYKDFSGNMGIVGTPVIDSSTGTIYLVARSVTHSRDSIFQQYLHAIDIATGAERPNSPVLITAQVAGNGDASVGGIINFNSQRQNQRAGLLLLNGIVYITWASHCDWAPYHGWVIGYDKTSLQQQVVYNTTPEGYNGGIWMSASAPAADEAGNIYLAVGNGSVGITNDPANLVNRSESALKLTPAGNTLAVSSFFTPKNYPYLESSDRDFGVAGMLLIPNTNRVLTGCKDGNLYLLDRDNMGGYNSTTNNIKQTIILGTNVWILRSSLGYYKGEQKECIYSWSEKAFLHAFPYDRNADTLDVINAMISGVQGPRGGNGSFFSLSSNGSVDSTAILWVNQAANGGNANQAVLPGVFRAFSATDVTKDLWNSAIDSNDNPGNYAKFNCPTVFNGKVYLATFSNKLMVYGLKAAGAGDTCNSVNIALNKPVVASTVAPGLDASQAFDNNLFTRWASYASDPQFIYVDLGARYDLCQVVLKWEVALGKDFQIQVSDDAVTWTAIKTITGNIQYENYLHVQGSGRYVRMLGTARGTAFGYSIWEFEVYGDPSSNPISGSGEICPGASTMFSINLPGTTYRWQLNTGSGFADLTDDINYTGTNTPNVQLNNLPSSCYGYQYRCVVDGVSSNVVYLTFSSTWNGLADNLWENPANWSCGALPDANTDVIINSGTVILNSNAIIRSITLSTGVDFTVSPGVTFTMTH
jgi:hypothetical protein